MVNEIKRKKVDNEVEKFFWEKHNLNKYMYYEWDKYGLVDKHTYYYDKYGLDNNVTSTSTWNEYYLNEPLNRIIKHKKVNTGLSKGADYYIAVAGGNTYNGARVSKGMYIDTGSTSQGSMIGGGSSQVQRAWNAQTIFPQPKVKYIPPVTKQEYDNGNTNVVIIDDRNTAKKMLVEDIGVGGKNQLFFGPYGARWSGIAPDYSVLSNPQYFEYIMDYWGPVVKTNPTEYGFGYRKTSTPDSQSGGNPKLGDLVVDYTYSSSNNILRTLWEARRPDPNLVATQFPVVCFMYYGDSTTCAYSKHIYSIMNPYSEAMPTSSNWSDFFPADCVSFRNDEGKLVLSGVYEWEIVSSNAGENALYPGSNVTTYMGIQYRPFTQSNLIDESETFFPLTELTEADINSYPYTGAHYMFLWMDDPTAEIGKGDFKRTVTATNNMGRYPLDGRAGNYWYEYVGTTYNNEPEVGDFIEQVSADSNSTYPADGIKDGYWYIYNSTETTQIKGSFIEKVRSTEDTTYPAQGIVDNNYYELDQQYQIGTGEGTYLTFVSSTDITAYPQYGVQGGYWYTRIDTPDDIYPAWDDSKLLSGVSYIQNVNPQNDFIIGAVGSASVEFTAIDKSSVVDGAKYYYYSNLRNEPNGLVLKCVFNITGCEKLDRGSYKIQGFDDLYLFEAVIDDWLFNTVQYPISVQNLYQSLCGYIGASFVNKTLPNGDYLLEDNFEGTNITGKMLLQYLAEMCAGFVYVTADGKIDIKGYSTKSVALNNTIYTKARYQDYTTPIIGKVIVKQSEDDVGTISGTGDVVYTIYNNPLFYVEEATEELQDAIDNIYTTVHSAAYVPGEVELQDDYGINCGDIITVDGNTFYVMEKQISSSGVKLSCIGNKVRETNTSLNAEIMALRGKTNELTRTIDMTQSTLTDVEAGLQSQITQTASSLTSYIDNEISGVNSTITQTANSLSSTITSQGQTITQIQQDLNGISLTYNSQNGTASITIGDVTVTNLVDGQYVSQVVAGIDLTGYVTFSALSTSGQTTINGDNITTGTINANRLNLTGSIAWGDLTSSCQSTIAAYAGSGVPSYIKSTYIDSTTIKSPTIYGAEIYAGTSADGYISMTSNGMNFISSVGGSLIGMGYYPGNYPYPYITLGQGIDAYGTDKGMIKKYSNGLWIGDSDGISDTSEGQGTGIFINFTTGVIYKYINGTATAI